MRVVWSAIPALMLAAVVACGPKPPPPEDQPPVTEEPQSERSAPSLDGREWSLVNLKDQPAPTGAGGRRATITFDTAAHRASGFAGCNRYGAEFKTAGDGLTFGPAMATKMACSEGDELERLYLAVLPEVTTYAVADSVLTLSGAAGPLARFHAP
jgi:heat shock protein HslJ